MSQSTTPAPAVDPVLGDLEPSQVRVRFPPSPTGNLHVGAVRSALYNYAFARHHGGTFVLRIEDTDAARSTEESYRGVIDSLRWLGLEWDEGPEVGGDSGPYLQSERAGTYADVARRLLEGGHAYLCFCTKEEQDARAAGRPKGAPSGYDGFCRDLDEQQVAAFRAEGREAVTRIRVPDGEIAFDDLIRGEISFDGAHVPDYVIVRANGAALYTLATPVDDALMGITHVLRGEDLLSSTPRQLVLHGALAQLGIGPGRLPRFGHLPYVMGEGNKKLSKRDAGSGLLEYRQRGFLPEGLLNYLALLGWGIAEDRDVFTLEEMVAAFDITKVNANPARFDPKKCEAINADHLRRLDEEELAEQLVPFLAAAGMVAEPLTGEQRDRLTGVVPLVRERVTTLAEIVPMAGFLFTDDDALEIDPAAGLGSKPDDAAVLQHSVAVLAELREWEHEHIQAALREALVEGLGIKPKFAFAPLRIAITGRRISPPLFESMELLGRTSSMLRLQRAVASLQDGSPEAPPAAGPDAPGPV
ncbi:glutamate--tRNA ligase [Auraticoccus monumenti]|uniref:Glutamate--tRNA ligase n=1 Tax=Auraticoccus monumenti TaxID=675864 RepID=A0A1G7CRT6_9ACTN|nr:glutamate--tRNA ligase [Auraticoccus monumenti]SDE41215.1 glutamyl-tRNA synthetase [Auraticoccus monumenti]